MILVRPALSFALGAYGRFDLLPPRAGSGNVGRLTVFREDAFEFELIGELPELDAGIGNVAGVANAPVRR